MTSLPLVAPPGEPVGVRIHGFGPPLTESIVWGALLVFHCQSPGSSKIVVKSSPPPAATVYIGDGQTTPTPYEPTPWDVALTQSPPGVPRPVGGEVYSTDKLAVLAPYIALICLASTVIMAVKRRRR
ncbi:MAG: hypothetical protein QXE79_03890 [Candidatus Bathyarchaeia archaeon]